jgi:hypothetical protein
MAAIIATLAGRQKDENIVVVSAMILPLILTWNVLKN